MSNNQDLITNLELSGWSGNCLALLPNVSEIQSGFVDRDGTPITSGFNSDAWGVSYELCNQYCNSDSIPVSFVFNTFASGVTNCSLPWLGMVSQIPAISGQAYKNILGLCLVLGSPTLATYSLSMTILLRYLARKRWNVLRRKLARSAAIKGSYHLLDQRFDAIQFFLEQAQQVPLRISQEEGWFAALLVIPRNQEWWKSVCVKLKDNMCTSSYALVASMIVAIVAYGLTIIAAFTSNLGDTETALQLSAGGLWVWLIPLVVGWITVGFQQNSHSVDAALRTRDANKTLWSSPPPDGGPELENEKDIPSPRAESIASLSSIGSEAMRDTQDGFLVVDEDGGLTPQPSLHRPNNGRFAPFSHVFDPRGDEKLRGPVFNYARSFTWIHLTRHVLMALNRQLDRMRIEHQQNLERRVRRVGPAAAGRGETHADAVRWNSLLEGNAEDIERLCCIDVNPLYAYPDWKEIPLDVFKSMGVATFMGIFVSFGTIGGAIMIAYLTPVSGIGCRSGGYLIYGVLSLISFMCALASQLMSHQWLLGYQRQFQGSAAAKNKRAMERANYEQRDDHHHHRHHHHDRDTNNDGINKETTVMGESSGSPTADSLGDDRDQPFAETRLNSTFWLVGSTKYRLLRATAAILRYTYKTIAVINALWLIISNLLVYSSAYNNCYCQSDYISLGPKAWVLLFKGADSLKSAALTPWATGVVLSLIVSLVAYLFFYFGAVNLSLED